LKIWICCDLFARFFCNILKIIEDLSEGWDTDLNAVDLGSGSLGNNSIELNVSWVDTGVTESVEESCWDT